MKTPPFEADASPPLLTESIDNTPPPCTLEPDEYRAHLADFNLTKAQEDELLHTLWDMMRMFAELGHGVNSINSVFPSIFENADQTDADLPDSGNNCIAEKE